MKREKSSFLLNVRIFLVPTFEPAGKMRVAILLGRVFEDVGAAKYETWMSCTPMSVTLMFLVLNCLERLAP